MVKNLVIVESPAKAKTIEGFLGKDFTVKSSFGHVRDLSKKDLGVDVNNGFKPEYEISSDKIKVVKELQKLAKEAEVIWLASDEDREGEAISWHLSETLHLDKEKTRRIVFHEITRSAILEAIQHPRNIDLNLVNAQQARRVLDRLVGFELSPVLWKKVKPALSAGRVQSVAVRLIVEREQEIRQFNTNSYFRITALFLLKKNGEMATIEAELPKKFNTRQEALDFLTLCQGATYTVSEVETKPATKTPAPPFTTSTLQQEASRKLGFSVSKTMLVAQQLYESGKITYMRTDSVNLSNMAMAMAKEKILELFGEKYVKTRRYTTKTKGAQEAHEAIRPTYLSHQFIEGDPSQKKLYDLIWKRTVASQMSDAKYEKTTVTINISASREVFQAKGEVLIFDGFLKVYLESKDDDDDEDIRNVIPPLSAGDALQAESISATQRYTVPPFRYSEASLVKRMEELGIGRPSTYAPTISTIQKRGYVEKVNAPGEKREFQIITLKDDTLSETKKTEKTGVIKGKLTPTDIGNLVNEFLTKNFGEVMDYNFTASVEKEFDEIANGDRKWNQMIHDFYGHFHVSIEDALKNTDKVKGERLLGVDPVSGKNIYVKIGRFGAMAQIGEKEDEEKPQFAGLKKGQSIDTISLEEALELFKFPRKLGTYQDYEMTVAIGRFGPYVRHNNNFFSLEKTDNPATIDTARAIEIIEAKRLKDKQNEICIFDGDPVIKVLNGRYGPYFQIEKENFRIPKTRDPKTLTREECLKMADEQRSTKKTRSSRGKK
ncbi:MAG: type I DNA topoisomerase [Bacteroidales bacterium]|nr:type I DNA topoisomerase [Bacteroidales bacterium]MDD3011378.1 type I DNA topoisomerase [Bacteroidales bacterium]MDD3961812.1 type I DNA topoisomerase [Bacteroidales bacterium]HPE87555.1 type I DNA topoisomerase [Bacteroidales bacterium]